MPTPTLVEARYATGRKHCSRCGCWRPIHDFGADRKRGILQSRCRTCDRILNRERNGFKPLPVGYCKRGHRLTPENTWIRPGGNKRCRTCHRFTKREWYRNMNPEQREHRNEGQRIYRHARGATPRPRPKPPQARDESLFVPAEPFVRWLHAHRPDGPLEEWAVALGCNETALRRHLAGHYETVHIDFADRVLMAAGGHLSEVYPYSEESA